MIKFYRIWRGVLILILLLLCENNIYRDYWASWWLFKFHTRWECLCFSLVPATLSSVFYWVPRSPLVLSYVTSLVLGFRFCVFPLYTRVLSSVLRECPVHQKAECVPSLVGAAEKENSSDWKGLGSGPRLPGF